MFITKLFVNDIFGRIVAGASRFARYNGKSTTSSTEIKTAVRLSLPGELAKHAVSEGTKTVTKDTGSTLRHNDAAAMPFLVTEQPRSSCHRSSLIVNQGTRSVNYRQTLSVLAQGRFAVINRFIIS